MALPTCNEDMNIISKLDDEPNDVGGLSAAALKAKFDLAGNLLKKALNDLVAALGNNTAAKNIGFAATTAVNADNVQDAIEHVQSQIAGVSQGAVANASITAEKIADGAVTSKKIQSGVVQSGHIAPRGLMATVPSDELTFGTTSTKCTVSTHWHSFSAALGVLFFGASFQHLSDADVERKVVYITASGTGGYSFSSLGSCSAYAAYNANGKRKHICTPAFTTKLTGGTTAVGVYLPDDITKDEARIVLTGWCMT